MSFGGFIDRLLRGKPPESPQAADRLVIRQLQGLGADLTRPRHVIHFLYFDSESDARGAAEELDSADYEVSVMSPHDKVPQWTVRAEGYRVVGATTVEAFRTWFEQLAAEFHGEYDGWEAASKP